jgi:hypothetical protein
MLHGSAGSQTIQAGLSHQTRDGEETDTECGNAMAARAVRIGSVKQPWVSFALGLALVAGCVDVAPTPSPTPTGAPTSAPSAQPTPELGSQVDTVVATVPAVRELDPTRDVPYEFITREQFREELIALTEAEIPVDVRRAEERLYKRLGLLAEDADLDALVQELYGAQVLAYYQPENGHFYVIGGDRPFGATDKLVVAHEYTHALQDQHFDLKDTVSDYTRGDAQLAELAVIEGDATLTSQLWTTDNLDFRDLLQLLIDGFSQLDAASLDGFPLVLRRQLEFPYTEGFVFATTLHDEGGFAAVNDALTTPPASTEQILHPEKYYAGELPAGVAAPDLLDQLGPEWHVAYEQTLGELGIQIIAAGGEVPEGALPGLPVDWPHADAAAGWDGDRLVMYESSDGHWRIEWTSAWDSAADAMEFKSRIDELSGTFTGVTVTGINFTRVDVSIADE